MMTGRMRLVRQQTLLWFLLLEVLLASTATGTGAIAGDYPSGPVKMIVSSGAGNAPDVIGRIVADQLARVWGHPVVVVNQPGAGGAIGVRAAGTSKPDGYTLYFAGAANFVALPELQASLPFDVARDFVPIGLAGEQPLIIGASPALGVKSLPELFALAKAKPGELNVGVLSRGGLPHLTGEWLRSASGVDLTIVHYTTTSQALSDVIGGRVHVVIEGLSALLGSLSGGSIKAVAVASAQRLPNMPDLPTVAETLPGFLGIGWFALMAPPRTHQAIAHKVSDDLRTILSRPELKQRYQELGTYVRPMSPGELTNFISAQQQMWKPIIAEVGLKGQR